MISLRVCDFASWRDAARRLLAANVNPAEVFWSAETQPLFESDWPEPTHSAAVPKEFVTLAESVALHRDPDRWGLLYRVLYRLTHGEKHLLALDIDDDVRRLKLMAKAVSRDMHKMTAFVRFRRVEKDGVTPEHYVAWHQPDHHIVEAIAPWFAKRFGSMQWSILTPDRTAHWDCHALTFGPGVLRSQAPDGDQLEDLWRDYYSSIFNPARVNIKAMTAEMPVRHWATLPEAEIISKLITAAGARVTTMATSQKTSAAEFIPQTTSLPMLRAAAPDCRGCELYARATQVVFGDGPQDARVVMVGEQPGDEEDRNGKPFVGPAGKLLNQAMQEAGLQREQIYVTNAVKHFKWIERGKRRIHAKPSGIEISACRPWLEAELAAVKPELVICLGATAAQSLMGREIRIMKDRGIFYPHRWAREIVATIHPSAILRMPERYDEEYALFLKDLRLIAERVNALGRTA